MKEDEHERNEIQAPKEEWKGKKYENNHDNSISSNNIHNVRNRNNNQPAPTVGTEERNERNSDDGELLQFSKVNVWQG